MKYHVAEWEGLLRVDANGLWVVEDDLGLAAGGLGAQLGQPDEGDGPIAHAIEYVAICGGGALDRQSQHA